MTDKQIKAFKVVFATAIAAFTVAETVNNTYGGKTDAKSMAMKNLHKEGLRVLKKIKPDDSAKITPEIISIISEMEMIMAQPIKTSQKYEKGGVTWITKSENDKQFTK